MADIKGSLVRLRRVSPAYWRVTFDNPPLNIFGPKTIPQFDDIISAIETDEAVKVVVFDSAVDGFFLTHYDFLAKVEDSTAIPPGRTGLQKLPDMFARLSRAPVVSIACIHGRATGVGSELALACDMRFASREKAVLSQWEVGAGLVPGGGPMARLPRLIGRGRALEVLLSADDVSGDLAERYGYVNRSFPDAELDAWVNALALRIASFDKQAIAATKRLVDINSLPSDAEIAPEWDAFLASLDRPATQVRIRKLFERGFHKSGDVENRLGYHVGQLGALRAESTRRIGPYSFGSFVMSLEQQVAASIGAPPALGERELVAIVAHELRCPLTARVYALELLANRGHSESEAQQTWAIIERQVRRAIRIIDDLCLSYVSTWNQIPLRTEVTDVTTVVKRAVQSTDHLVAGRGHLLTVSLPVRPLLVYGDPSRLEQVLINLLANASKFTELGGHIQLTAKAELGEVVIRVRDNGRGIALHLLPRVFDLFSQGHNLGGRSERGFGLGLAPVKSFIELHGGDVEAFSDGPGRGAEFVVRLPACNDVSGCF